VPPVHAEPATANLFIVNPFGALDTLSRWFSTHPPMAERIERLRALGAGSPRPRSRYAMAGTH
jgi:heat shock protein HtpX